MKKELRKGRRRKKGGRKGMERSRAKRGRKEIELVA